EGRLDAAAELGELAREEWGDRPRLQSEESDDGEEIDGEPTRYGARFDAPSMGSVVRSRPPLAPPPCEVRPLRDVRRLRALPRALAHDRRARALRERARDRPARRPARSRAAASRTLAPHRR